MDQPILHNRRADSAAVTWTCDRLAHAMWVASTQTLRFDLTTFERGVIADVLTEGLVQRSSLVGTWLADTVLDEANLTLTLTVTRSPNGGGVA